MKKVSQLFLGFFFKIKYSKTTYPKHHIHVIVNIQNMKKMWDNFNRKKLWALNRGTLTYFHEKYTKM